MAALFDSSVAVLKLRRNRPHDAEPLLAAATVEIEAGSAMIASASVCELMMGERSPGGIVRLEGFLSLIPAVALVREAAARAGEMGSFLADVGAPIPVPDLLIAATAVWLDVPLLTWDADYAQSKKRAARSRLSHPGADHWRTLRLHATSRS